MSKIRKINANFASFDLDFETVTFGFCDKKYNPSEYVIIQFSISEKIENFNQDTDGVYIEIDDQIYSGYNLIKYIE